MNDKFINAKEFTIKMTKSEDGKFYPKDIYMYLDGELATFVAGVMLDAHIDEGVRMTISYLLTDKGDKPERDEKGYVYRHWKQDIVRVPAVILDEEEDEDDIELVEESDE